MSKEENCEYNKTQKFKDIKIESIKIRDVLPEDAERIQEIYSPYVADTTISFEITVPNKLEMKRRIEKALSNGFPYIVAENETGTVIGYAYADRFGEREAYRYSFIVSIYLDMKVQSRGIGQKLYDELEKRMKKMNRTSKTCENHQAYKYMHMHKESTRKKGEKEGGRDRKKIWKK